MRTPSPTVAAAVRDRITTLTLLPQARLHLLLAATTVMVARSASAQTTADPSAPLPQISAAQTAAKKSTLNVTDFKAGSTNFTDVLIYGGAAGGAACVLYAFYEMYMANRDESGRRSSGRAGVSLIIGACLGVFAVFMALVQNYATGNQTAG